MSIAVDKVICAKNNNNGINFKLNCKAGNHVVKYHTGTVSGQSSYKVSNKVTLKIMNWGNRVMSLKLIWLEEIFQIIFGLKK